MTVAKQTAAAIERLIDTLRPRVSTPAFAIVELRAYEDGHTQVMAGVVGTGFHAHELARDTALATILSLDDAPDLEWGRLPHELEEALAAEIADGGQPRVEAVAYELARELGKDPDVALLTRYGFGENRDELGPMREALGQAAVERFLSRFAPGPEPEPELRADDRGSVERLAIERGIEAPRARELAADARWGLMLEPDATRTSRLGGRPVLPAGTSWPTHDGRSMTHLASIDLAELPVVEGRELLPAGGVLAFFADLGEESELYEYTREAEDDGVRLVVSEPDVATHEPGVPDGIEMPLRERRVAARPRLQVRETIDPGPEADLAEDLAGGWEGVHQLLGHPTNVQEDPRQGDEVALLHMNWDEPLGFVHLDGGDLLVFAAADVIASRRWRELTWVSSSS